MTADVLSDLVKSVDTRLNSIDRVTTCIDYAVASFQEVDVTCANRIKNIGFDFRRSSGLLSSSEKFSLDPIGSIMSDGKKIWKESGASDFWIDIAGKDSYYGNHKFIIDNAVTCALEVGSMICGWVTAAGIVALAGVAAVTPVGWIIIGVVAVGALFSANSIIDSGTKIAEKATGNKEEDCDGANGFRYVMGEDNYNRAQLVVSTANIGTGGFQAVSDYKAINALKAARGVKEAALIENAKQAASTNLRYNNLLEIDKVRKIQFANKVAGVTGKESRAFAQSKSILAANSDRYADYTDLVRKNIPNAIKPLRIDKVGLGLGVGSLPQEDIYENGVKSFNKLTSTSSLFKPSTPQLAY